MEFREVDILQKPTFPYATTSKTPAGLVIHYTVSGRTAPAAQQVLKGMKQKKLCCPVLDGNGVIHVPSGYDVLRDAGYHAGLSKWGGMYGLSNLFAGVEVCSWGRVDLTLEAATKRYGKCRKTELGVFQAFTLAQEETLFKLAMWLERNSPGFSFENVVGHSEVSPERKIDPGGSLSVSMGEFRKRLKERATSSS